ncbi:CDP-alcohol phosphatidyltransferase family protein [Kineococcus glutinatus]|uniref:CDP-diacylglycerol--glycerol-3-phosphate 3-phosphatidyltransferase n=1 Tax=Kineococcus glutinatus TaxID=1070872 RepID=A0ABP9HWI7_9ACTN
MTTLSADRQPPARLPAAEPTRTVANLVTAVRTALAVALGCAASARGSQELLVAAYAAYWAGDVLDGWCARRLGQETRRGAVFDIVSDRACTSLLAVVFLSWNPQMALPVGLFLVQFMVVDCLLTLGFLHWPLLGPNDFHRVDRRLYLLNWSPPAKALNTAGVVLAVLAGSFWVATAVAVLLLVVKGVSSRRMLRLVAERAAQVAAPAAPGPAGVARG